MLTCCAAAHFRGVEVEAFRSRARAACSIWSIILSVNHSLRSFQVMRLLDYLGSWSSISGKQTTECFSRSPHTGHSFLSNSYLEYVQTTGGGIKMKAPALEYFNNSLWFVLLESLLWLLSQWMTWWHRRAAILFLWHWLTGRMTGYLGRSSPNNRRSISRCRKVEASWDSSSLPHCKNDREHPASRPSTIFGGWNYGRDCIVAPLADVVVQITPPPQGGLMAANHWRAVRFQFIQSSAFSQPLPVRRGKSSVPDTLTTSFGS